MKNYKNNFANRQTERNRKYKEKIGMNGDSKTDAKQPVKVEPVVERKPISAPIKWGGYNPITNTAFVPQVSTHEFIPQVPAPVRVPQAHSDGFITVQRHRSRPSPESFQIEAPHESLTGKARKAQRAKNWKMK